MRFTIYKADTGNNVNTALPSAKLFGDPWQAQQNSLIQGLTLQSLVINPTTTPVVVVAATNNNTPIGINGANILIVHPFGRAPMSVGSGSAGQRFISAKLFGEGAAMEVAKGQYLSLYCSAPNDATVLIYAWLTIEYIYS